MPASEQRKLNVDTKNFTILNITPPFVDILLKSTAISPRDFSKIVRLTAEYQNDGRLIEMVRHAGDNSAKVPYLMNKGETPDSILAALREAAGPSMKRFDNFPDPLQSTICLLLSLNAVPSGCETYAITALLEIDWMQEEMIQTLRGLMVGRQLARDFYQDNLAALNQLDQDWPRLRKERTSQWHPQELPEKPQMQYYPLFENDRLVSMHQTCVIVDSPGAKLLQRFIPPVLLHPLPEAEPAPSTRSVDWLIRDAGKIGRHFTRALLRIIKTHLEEEQVALEAANYDLINRRAQEALRDYVKNTP
jgi:hypothetical protein